MKARFKGKVHLTDLDPPNGYKISGEGDGGIAGFAKGGAVVVLTPKDGGTLLTYNVEAQIGGKLAQLGQRLINGVGQEACRRFFREICRGGEVGAGRLFLVPSPNSASVFQIWSCSKDEIARKTISFVWFSVPASQAGVK